MTRLKNLFHINPIIVKEIRSRMRGPRAFITLTLMLLAMGGLMYGMLQLILANARYSNVLSPQVGQTLFASLAFLLLFMIAAVTPAVTAGAISGEKEKQTYEMLMSTPLSSTSILWGKLVSALSYVLLLLFAAIPLASVVFIFGGVTLREMLKALMVLLVIAAAFGVLGLFYSALLGRTGRATVASFLTVAALMFGPIFIAGLVGVLRSSEPPRWILAPSPISALSGALAPSMGANSGGELFYLLGGIFNMGVSPVSFNGIPRPLYHYTLPFYIVLSLVLYLLAARFVQPARRWRVSTRQVLASLGVVGAVVGLTVAGFLYTAPRYEWAPNNQQTDPNMVGPMEPAQILPADMGEKEVQVTNEATPTPTPAPASIGPDAPENSSGVVLSEAAQAEIYAAVARQLYTVDHTFGDKQPNWTTLHIISMPTGGAATFSEEVISGVSERLSDLPAKIIWEESEKGVAKDPNTGAVDNGTGAIISFSAIEPQPDGTVHAAASLYFASLGATGKTYILSQVNGAWQITGTTGVEWIS